MNTTKEIYDKIDKSRKQYVEQLRKLPKSDERVIILKAKIITLGEALDEFEGYLLEEDDNLDEMIDSLDD